MVDVKCPKCGAMLNIEVQAKSKTTDAPKSLTGLKQLFPHDLEEMLVFEGTEEYLVVRPRQFLGSENFAKIAAIVREAGGEYVSAGKESHFRVAL